MNFFSMIKRLLEADRGPIVKMSRRNPQYVSNYIAIGATYISLIALFIAGFGGYLAYKQWETASDQELRQLRAYLGSEEMQINGFIDVEKRLYITNIFKNFGSTPAYAFHYIWGWKMIGKEGKSHTYVYSSKEMIYGIDSSQTVYQGSTRPWQDTLYFNENESKSFFEKHEIAIYFGKVFYRDIFNRDDRTVLFCYIIQAEQIEQQRERKQATPARRCNNGDEAN